MDLKKKKKKNGSLLFDQAGTYSKAPSHPPVGALALVCHRGHQARSSCLVLMNGERASVLTLPSISFCGCTALKTDNPCQGHSATLVEL